MRMIVEFCKGPAVRFISHLDLMRAVQRALRRSGLPVKYSGGFNPHQILAFAAALRVGATSTGEIMDVGLTQEVSSEEFLRRLGKEMPPDLNLRSAHQAPDNYPSMMSIAAEADYQISLRLWARCSLDELRGGLQRMMDNPILATKKTKAGPKEIDLRELICRIGVDESEVQGEMTVATLSLRCVCAQTGALNPELLLPRLLEGWGLAGEYDVCRTGFYAITGEGERVPLWAL